VCQKIRREEKTEKLAQNPLYEPAEQLMVANDNDDDDDNV